MQALARAGVEIHENILRYAEVEQQGNGYRLLRLGSCDFDFDLGEELLGGSGDERKLDTLADALKDVFAGTTADNLHVAVHPPGGYSFFTPLPSTLEAAAREERINQEVDLLVGGEAGPGALYISSDAVYEETAPDGRAVSWVHIWAVQDHIFDRFERLFATLPYRNNRLKLSMQAAASVVTALGDGRTGARGAFTLALGWYAGFVEYTLCRDRRWHFSHYARVSSPADAAYFALTLLRRMNIAPAEVAQVYLYGRNVPAADFSILQAVFGRAPERLNPVTVVNLDPASLSPDFDAEAYVPCIGVALS